MTKVVKVVKAFSECLCYCVFFNFEEYHRVIIICTLCQHSLVTNMRMLSCISNMATCAVGVVVAGSNLKCSICLEFFTDPRILPCLHTYCLKCLQRLVNDQKNDLSCPQCRVKHKIPKGGVTSYLCDLSILPELEAAKITTNKEETKICDFCITGEVAVSFCNECSEYLCQYCNDMHKRGKRTSTHTLSLLEEASSFHSSTLARLIKQDPYCSHHSDYKLEIFCKTCNTLVCCMCMLESTHKGHSYDFYKNVQDELMKWIRLMTANIEEKEKKLQCHLTFVKKYEQQICSQRDKLEAEINAVCDEYITKIQTMKEELLKQVESKFTEDSKTIWATTDHLEVMIAQVKSSHAFSKRYQKQSKGQMLSLLNQLIHSLTELDSKDIDVSVIFDSSTPRIIFKKSPNVLTRLGTLTLAQVNKEALTEGTLQKTIVITGVKNTLIYILNNPLANLVKWECKCSCGGIIYHCPVTVTSDNRLEVQFTPIHAAKYNFKLRSTGSSFSGVQAFSITVARNCCIPSKVSSVVPSTVHNGRKVATYKIGVSVFVGDRVKRGPDWKYYYEDGGAGNLGTVVSICGIEDEYDVTVKWDFTGIEDNYCCGSQGKYDLELFQ